MFVEQHWRSIKYQQVYLHADQTLQEACVGIGLYPAFYNCRCRHCSLDRQAPNQAYSEVIQSANVAAESSQSLT